MPSGAKKNRRKAAKKKKEKEAHNNISTNDPEGRGFFPSLSF
jgi:hypothetical protein